MNQFQIKLAELIEVSVKVKGEGVTFATIKMIQATLIFGALTIFACNVVQVLGAN